MKDKPIISIDFDGCIHSYDRGWQNGEIYGELVPGFLEWAVKAVENFSLVIHSSRANTFEGRAEVLAWIRTKAVEAGMPSAGGIFGIAATKPPALISIDDRAFRFDGDWGAEELTTGAIFAFKPWMNRSNA